MDSNNVDILVIGAGASSAAAVSNLSSLGVNILCLEQGDWMNTNEYPSNFKNTILWEMDFRKRKFRACPPLSLPTTAGAAGVCAVGPSHISRTASARFEVIPHS